MLPLHHITSDKWICTSDYTVLANLGFYLAVYIRLLKNITMVSVSIGFTVETHMLDFEL